jgi:tetratricopeptide (TPR) repeat protein
VGRAAEKYPGDYTVTLQAAKIRFGKVMVDDYLSRGAFRHAYETHDHLLNDADRILNDDDASIIHNEVRVRRPHLRRQQAEMLRNMGRYSESLLVIESVIDEYPAWQVEERCWAQVSKADSLRLLGRSSDAMKLLQEIEKVARDREISGLLGSVLLRKSRVLLLGAVTDKRSGQPHTGRAIACIEEASEIVEAAPNRYRYVTIYVYLAKASLPGADSASVEKLLSRVARIAKISKSSFVTEYAHLLLCRAEMFRTLTRNSEARRLFKEAHDIYRDMECMWGAVRSWIGLTLTGGTTPRPHTLFARAEGLDQELINASDSGVAPSRGLLATNWL